LPSSSHRPRKRFGQHFLHDPRVLGRIVDAIAPSASDFLVEIGPGEGALTAPLIERAGRLEAIELDRDLMVAPSTCVRTRRPNSPRTCSR
jgi:16S rRNA (adenine1518-N6/adenine1519-N6)-dimethyltransferase